MLQGADPDGVQDVALDLEDDQFDNGNQLPSVEEARAQNDFAGKPSGGVKRNALFLFGAVAVLVIVIAVIATSGGGKKGSSSNSSSAQDDTNTIAKLTNRLTESDAGQYLVSSMYDDETNVFLSTDSPQAKALAWMLDNDKLGLPIPKVGDTAETAQSFVQRYIIAVFTIAVVPTSVRQSFGLMDPNKSECVASRVYEDISVDDATTRMSLAKTFGIVCNDDNQILEMKFATLDLNGDLPTRELEALQNIKTMELDVNLLEGSIPIIESLEYLTISHNRFEGSLPSNLGDMTNLEIFSATSNSLLGELPQSIKHLKLIKVLALDDNYFVGGFDHLTDLHRLRELYLGDNKFTETLTHQSFQQQANLQIMSLRNNQLQGPLPSVWFTDLLALRYLDIHKNSIGNTEEWNNEDMKDYQGVIEYIDVSLNQMRGTLPRSFQFLSSHLTHLDASRNGLTEKIPDTFQNLVNLKALLVSGLNTGGRPVPDWLPLLTKLRYLSMQETVLTGTIPTFIGDMTALKLLDLDYNDLREKIPTEIAKLVNLKYLQLNNNQLTGTVPVEVQGMDHLQLLTLENNQLTGQLGPTTEQNCPISMMTSDCGNPEYDCPHCEDKDVTLTQLEIKCPCCNECCYGDEDESDCDSMELTEYAKNDILEFSDVRSRRQRDGISSGDYWFYKRNAVWQPLSADAV